MKVLVCLIFASLILLFLNSCSGTPVNFGVKDRKLKDTTLNADTLQNKAAIAAYFKSSSAVAALNFPLSTRRFYVENGDAYAWLSFETQRQLSEAMMLLDCVVQYGLVSSAYHRDAVSYDALRVVLKDSVYTDPAAKAVFDVLLTDAMLSFINHLHYGRLNPSFTPQRIDGDTSASFNASDVLRVALKRNFTAEILSVQPKYAAYQSMQTYLKLTTGQYTGDCYEFDDDTLKLVALNMERYRWLPEPDSVYLEVNIPSYTLSMRNMKQEVRYRIIVGKAQSPTPVIASAIRSIQTAPEWSVPQSIMLKELLPKIIADPQFLERNHMVILNSQGRYVAPSRSNLALVKANPHQYSIRQASGSDNALGKIVFYFPNRYRVHLHDTPEPQLFKLQARALSHGCIRVEQPKKLAKSILEATKAPAAVFVKVSKAMDNNQRVDYRLPRPLPIIIKYITCDIQDGLLVSYPDIYKKDKNLVNQLFGSVSLVQP